MQKVVRVHSHEDGVPYAHYVSWTTGISKGFTKKKLENQARVKLLRENGIILTAVKQFLSAEHASARIAKELDIEPGAALLAVRRLGQVEGGTVVDVLDGLYNPQRYQYAMEMSIDGK